jgi:hypothetical protein
MGLRDGEKLPRESEARKHSASETALNAGLPHHYAKFTGKKKSTAGPTNVPILRNPSTSLRTTSIASPILYNFMPSHKHISQLFLALTTAFIY